MSDSDDEKAGNKGSALSKLMAEEAEREKYAKEFEERSEKERSSATSEAESRVREERERQKLLAERKGKPNPNVYLDIEVRSGEGHKIASGRVEIELFADVVPKTAENFRCLCTGEKGRKLHYKGGKFHRIVPGFMAQGGDITNGDGTGGVSIYGKHFNDESFARLHSRSNLLSMANCGANTNNSQFFILFAQQQHLDRKHVVFGEVVREDGNIMKSMIARGSEAGDVQGEVIIVDCGEHATAEDEQRSRDRFRRSRTRSTSRRKKRTNQTLLRDH
jgi:cyclophilin family peptidyl-prolyl cis-trans isomerase